MDINPHLNRRGALQLAAATLLATTTGARAVQPRPSFASTTKALADLERRSGGRLGVGLLDTATGQTTGHRQGERFAMCSTFKMPLAAAILREIDQGRLRADQWVAYGKADLVAHAPATTQNLAHGGMTVHALAEAAQTISDNPAANLLLKLIGGPAGFTSILRTIGDTTTRLDRYEPDINGVTGQDLRDTTTPAAMARTAAHLLTTDWLSAGARDTLTAWMVATTTGSLRLRAGLPGDWRAGDKTGTGGAPQLHDKYNDIAIAWPPGKAPIVITAFLETRASHANMRDEDQAVLAEVGRIATAWSRSL